MRTQTAAADLTGTLVGGYRLERLLGGSGRAQVYHGRHAQLGRQAAIKILSPHLALDEEAMSRFFCEARPIAGLGSEHLVEVYDFVFEPRKERVAYVMEYLAGDDLPPQARPQPALAPAAGRAHRRRAVRCARRRSRRRRRPPRHPPRQHHARASRRRSRVRQADRLRLLFEMLTGAPPFHAATSAATIELHLHARAPSVLALR